MNRSRRKSRPLIRDRQIYRDDRMYIVACDDTYAPKQYFDGFEKDFMPFRLQVKVIETRDGTSSAEHVLDRLLKIDIETYDERWLLLDADHYTTGTHLKSFKTALRRAQKTDVNIAVNKPCFEFWLLLHYLQRNDPDLLRITNAGSAEKLLKKTLGGYKKRSLDTNHFPLTRVPQAVMEARAIDSTVFGGDIPQGNTSRVYRLWERILHNASPAQLPEELQDLKQQLPELENER